MPCGECVVKVGMRAGRKKKPHGEGGSKDTSRRKCSLNNGDDTHKGCEMSGVMKSRTNLRK